MITNDLILNIVSDFLEIPISEILKPNGVTGAKNAEVVKARQFCIYLSYKYIKDSERITGKYFGNRDHSTIHTAIATVNKFIKIERNYRMQLEECENKLLNKDSVHDFAPQDVEISAENLNHQRQ